MPRLPENPSVSARETLLAAYQREQNRSYKSSPVILTKSGEIQVEELLQLDLSGSTEASFSLFAPKDSRELRNIFGFKKLDIDQKKDVLQVEADKYSPSVTISLPEDESLRKEVLGAISLLPPAVFRKVLVHGLLCQVRRGEEILSEIGIRGGGTTTEGLPVAIVLNQTG